jgi:hypothetical protein
MVNTPAIVVSAHMDLLAANLLGRALYSDAIAGTDRSRPVNFARFAFVVVGRVGSLLLAGIEVDEPGDTQSSSSASLSASLIMVSSSWLTRPTNAPSRSGATAAVCSTNTCVCSLLIAMAGRKSRGAADREVGATSTVDNMRSSD